MGRSVAMGQLYQHDAIRGIGIAVDGGAHVQHVVDAAGEDDGRAFALELGHDQPGQFAGVGQGDGAGRCHRTAGSAQDHGCIGGGQALARQEEQFLQGFLVVAQGVGDVDVAGTDGVAAQRLGPAGDGLGHLDHVDAALEFGGHKEDGLGAVHQHGPHLVPVGGLLDKVRGDAEGHQKVDVVQRVTDDAGLDDVLQGARPPLAGADVDHVGAIGPGSEEHVVPLQGHHPPAVPVAEYRSLGRHRQRPLDHAGRDAHPIPILNGDAFLLKKGQRLRLVKAHAGAIQDLQAGVVEPLDLVVGKFAKLRCVKGGIVALQDHGSVSLLDIRVIARSSRCRVSVLLLESRLLPLLGCCAHFSKPFHLAAYSSFSYIARAGRLCLNTWSEIAAIPIFCASSSISLKACVPYPRRLYSS